MVNFYWQVKSYEKSDKICSNRNNESYRLLVLVLTPATSLAGKCPKRSPTWIICARYSTINKTEDGNRNLQYVCLGFQKLNQPTHPKPDTCSIGPIQY